MNHFELFGLSCQFDLDDGFLSSQFIELQRRFHPDRFATGSAQERLIAVQKAAQINDAYQTLRHPIQRAEYLLSLNGVELNETQQSMQDPEFLMQQMCLREELEEITLSHDPEQLLIAFDDKIQQQYLEMISDLRHAFEQSLWLDASVIVKKLQFLMKLKQEIERIEDQLLD